LANFTGTFDAEARKFSTTSLVGEAFHRTQETSPVTMTAVLGMSVEVASQRVQVVLCRQVQPRHGHEDVPDRPREQLNRGNFVERPRSPLIGLPTSCRLVVTKQLGGLENVEPVGERLVISGLDSSQRHFLRLGPTG
jgi:hypothetical protein